jgi:PilZ domain
MNERRVEIRRKTFLRGRILFNSGRAAVDCLIRDISPVGARLIFSDAVSVPDVVELYIPQKEQTLEARVEWRHGDEVGIAFANASQMTETSNGLAERVERLEAEVAALKKMLKRLKTDLSGNDEAA